MAAEEFGLLPGFKNGLICIWLPGYNGAKRMVAERRLGDLLGIHYITPRGGRLDAGCEGGGWGVCVEF
jgi:hypothetical protein